MSSFESTELTNVQFSTSLKKLGDGAFKNTRLTELTLPNIEISEFGEGVFVGITTLKRATLGGTTKIPKDTFKGCIFLNEVDGFEKVTYYGDNCFDGAIIPKITFAEKVDKLGSNAFVGNSIAQIRLPQNPIKDFGENVFENCLNLFAIDFGGNTVIPPGTLKRCNALTLVSGTENVKMIGKDAFKQTDQLQSINLYGNLETLLDPLESQSNLFFHGYEVPKTLTSEPLLKADLRIFVTENFKADKFGDNVVMKLNCSITQFIDVSEPNPMCKNCEEMKATLDGDNYYCDLDMTECLSTHQKCQICIEGKCQKCEEKLLVDTVKDVCVSECPNGYYDGTVICEKCKEHYEKPCKDEECEKCTGGVGGIVIAALVAILLFMF
ncbi:hypothetical protein EIN_500870 [Entamoeba invadens IP1]|uniref:Surface antigen BspA-like n=1 Tax=Entamoeba invadens IP1 TaxID=370355 RepID=L7FJ89_ENTIV|nr:hypothetical protein EIN_500870 [Entamoeba invadens IP1]ELP83969.1 hypothetical protein EIN_500870 [Entamoeba invadens IP1]|eukprot:XP_004183315.1 hypothetical protein EIN_500870 [Entamoeba invadens IP1]